MPMSRQKLDLPCGFVGLSTFPLIRENPAGGRIIHRTMSAGSVYENLRMVAIEEQAMSHWMWQNSMVEDVSCLG